MIRDFIISDGTDPSLEEAGQVSYTVVSALGRVRVRLEATQWDKMAEAIRSDPTDRERAKRLVAMLSHGPDSVMRYHRPSDSLTEAMLAATDVIGITSVKMASELLAEVAKASQTPQDASDWLEKVWNACLEAERGGVTNAKTQA